MCFHHPALKDSAGDRGTQPDREEVCLLPPVQRNICLPEFHVSDSAAVWPILAAA